MPNRLHRTHRVLVIVAIVTAWILASAPIAAAGNATGKNVTLPRAGVFTGKVFGKDTGLPIANAWIYASPVDYTGGASSGYATTDSNGAFTIRGLTAGKKYTVSVDPDDGIHYRGYWNTNADHFKVGPTYDPNTYVTLPAFITPAATTAGVNLGTIRAPKGFTISGVVKGGAATLDGVDVTLEGDDYDWASTAGGGKFAFKGLAPGTYQLIFETPSSMNWKDGVYKTNGGTNWANPSAMPSNIVITTANKTANITLPAGFTVQGVVQNAAGVVQPNASIDLDGPAGSEFDTTDAAGKYVIKGVASGSGYTIAVDAPGWPSQTLMSGWFKSGATGNFTPTEAQATLFAVSGNQTKPTIKLPTGYTITGSVFLPDGTTPANGARLSASAAGSYSYQNATAAANGTFTIRGLEPGTYTVQAQPKYATPTLNLHGGYVDSATPTHRLSTNESAADPFVLSASAKTKATGKLVLWTGWTISGTIYGGTTATPLANTSIGIWGPTYAFLTTNANGFYKAVGLEPGKYTVRVGAPSASPWESGYRKAGVAPNFTRDYSSAEQICVGPTVPCP